MRFFKAVGLLTTFPWKSSNSSGWSSLIGESLDEDRDKKCHRSRVK